MHILNRLLKNKELKDSSIVLASSIISQIASFFVVLLITKALTNEEYGKYAVVNTVLSLVTDLSDMGMNSSVTKFVAGFHQNDPEKEMQVINYATYKKARNSVIVIILMMVSSKLVARYLIHDSSYNIYLVLTSFCIGFTLISSMNKAIFQGRQDYKKYFLATLADITSYVVCIIFFYITGKLTIFTIITSNIIRMFLSMVISSRMAVLNLKKAFQPVKNIEIIKRFNAFGNWMLLWAVFANLQSRADVLLLSHFTTATEVSYYDIANKLTKPILMVLSAYATVMNPIFAQLSSKDKLKEKIRQTSKFILIISLFLICAVFISGIVITLFFGNKYENSLTPLRIMLVSLVFFVWTVPYNSTLYALDKPYIFALAAGTGLVINIIGDFLLLPRFGATGASVTYFIAQVQSLLVAYISYKKLVKFDDNQSNGGIKV